MIWLAGTAWFSLVVLRDARDHGVSTRETLSYLAWAPVAWPFASAGTVAGWVVGGGLR